MAISHSGLWEKELPNKLKIWVGQLTYLLLIKPTCYNEKLWVNTNFNNYWKMSVRKWYIRYSPKICISDRIQSHSPTYICPYTISNNEASCSLGHGSTALFGPMYFSGLDIRAEIIWLSFWRIIKILTWTIPNKQILTLKDSTKCYANKSK